MLSNGMLLLVWLRLFSFLFSLWVGFFFFPFFFVYWNLTVAELVFMHFFMAWVLALLDNIMFLVFRKSILFSLHYNHMCLSAFYLITTLQISVFSPSMISTDTLLHSSVLCLFPSITNFHLTVWLKPIA